MASSTNREVILVTGATNGIGLDTVIYLASASPAYHVIIGARNLTKGETVLQDIQARSLPGSVSLVQLDADSDASIASAVATITQDFGHLDVLINNAGICPETQENAWPTRSILRSTFETNVFGPTILTAALVPLLKLSPNPRIVNVSSGLGSIAMLSDHSGAFSAVKAPAYRMSKTALNMLTAYQYYQLKGDGVKVWTYCPGYVVTDLSRDRAQREGMGLDSSETSAQGILEIVRGERDRDVGGFIARKGGKYEW